MAAAAAGHAAALYGALADERGWMDGRRRLRLRLVLLLVLLEIRMVLLELRKDVVAPRALHYMPARLRVEHKGVQHRARCPPVSGARRRRHPSLPMRRRRAPHRICHCSNHVRHSMKR